MWFSVVVFQCESRCVALTFQRQRDLLCVTPFSGPARRPFGVLLVKNAVAAVEPALEDSDVNEETKEKINAHLLQLIEDNMDDFLSDKPKNKFYYDMAKQIQLKYKVVRSGKQLASMYRKLHSRAKAAHDHNIGISRFSSGKPEKKVQFLDRFESFIFDNGRVDPDHVAIAGVLNDQRPYKEAPSLSISTPTISNKPTPSRNKRTTDIKVVMREDLKNYCTERLVIERERTELFCSFFESKK